MRGGLDHRARKEGERGGRERGGKERGGGEKKKKRNSATAAPRVKQTDTEGAIDTVGCIYLFNNHNNRRNSTNRLGSERRLNEEERWRISLPRKPRTCLWI